MALVNSPGRAVGRDDASGGVSAQSAEAAPLFAAGPGAAAGGVEEGWEVGGGEQGREKGESPSASARPAAAGADADGARGSGRPARQFLPHLTPEGWLRVFDVATPRETVGALMKAIEELHSTGWILEAERSALKDLVLRANVHTLAVLAAALADLCENADAAADFLDTLRLASEWSKLM
jgi:hypothetical protein